MRRRIITTLALAILAACSSGPPQAPVLGEAFVGPATLQIRQELTSRAALVATVKHGDRLSLIGRRRRFYKVRTSSDAEGWVDGRQLLSREDMSDLKELAERAANAPSQGRASVFELLNVHTLPNRQSPSFFQIRHDQQVEVVAHERAPRVPFDPPDFIKLDSTPLVVKKAKKKAEPAIPRPPAGKPPEVPKNWLDLSGNPDGFVPEQGEKIDNEEPKPQPPAIPMDDWTLIRSKDGSAGWVLARMLLMAIPDEVAQYAERARITAYFNLGSVNDDGVEKPVWMWATLAQRGVSFQFDSLRIFNWNARRHRYETSFIERGMKGYLPILLQGSPATSFQVVVEEKDGRSMEREYRLNGFRARVVGRHEGQVPAPWNEQNKIVSATAPAKAPEKSLKDKAKGFVEGVKRRFKR
ncbi:SH3 domain-containing protein [uncultured Paludibaculum sp.]|uniref:SH3 domain-containing protein n=1 Tax=uncultured Paludibaculum sp. TaxID=1765020 RepID=UPI002AAC0F37|nr:SH3 domain-containing protein [uncultured Paludibaculum sp.]